MTLLDDVLPRCHVRGRHVYWLVVRPRSGLIRRSWLRAIKRWAEQA